MDVLQVTSGHFSASPMCLVVEHSAPPARISFWCRQSRPPQLSLPCRCPTNLEFFSGPRYLPWVISTLRWAVLTVFWIGFCHTGPISLCVDIFVFICVYFVCFCFILHSCCIIVSTVGWTWWDWSLILVICLPSVLWHFVRSFDS